MSYYDCKSYLPDECRPLRCTENDVNVKEVRKSIALVCMPKKDNYLSLGRTPALKYEDDLLKFDVNKHALIFFFSSFSPWRPRANPGIPSLLTPTRPPTQTRRETRSWSGTSDPSLTKPRTVSSRDNISSHIRCKSRLPLKDGKNGTTSKTALPL